MAPLTLQLLMLKGRLVKEWHYSLLALAFVSCIAPVLLMICSMISGLLELSNYTQEMTVTTCLFLICLVPLVIMLFYSMNRLISNKVKASINELYAFRIMGIGQRQFLSGMIIDTVMISIIGVLLAVWIIQLFEAAIVNLLSDMQVMSLYLSVSRPIELFTVWQVVGLIMGLSVIFLIVGAGCLSQVKVSG